MSKKPALFLQNDSRWGKVVYTSTGNTKQTIGNSGCGPTSGAMAISQWLREYLPTEACKDALAWGTRTASNGTSLSFFDKLAQKFGLTSRRTKDTQEVYDLLNKSKGEVLVVCNIGPDYWTKNGHYILLWDARDGYIYANDPASVNRTKNTIDSFKKQAKSYVILTKPGFVADTNTPVVTKRVLRWKDAKGNIVKPLMNGDDVKTLQAKLESITGVKITGGIDGKFGEGTDKAVRSFQTAKKLKVDGVVGAATWAALDS